MKILDAGDHMLSNADILDWIRLKRVQHEREDVQDASRGVSLTPRSKNFMTALSRHERELTSTTYPYTKNPSVYSGENRTAAFEKFALEVENVVQGHLEDQWRDRLLGMSKEQIDREYAPVQETKCLTEPELLVIFNHAPTCVEMLQPMIESVDDRFTAEEQQLIVDVIVRRLRCDEKQADETTVAAADSGENVLEESR